MEGLNAGGVLLCTTPGMHLSSGLPVIFYFFPIFSEGDMDFIYPVLTHYVLFSESQKVYTFQVFGSWPSASHDLSCSTVHSNAFHCMDRPEIHKEPEL